MFLLVPWRGAHLVMKTIFYKKTLHTKKPVDPLYVHKYFSYCTIVPLIEPLLRRIYKVIEQSGSVRTDSGCQEICRPGFSKS